MVSLGTLLSRAGGLKGLYWSSAHTPSLPWVSWVQGTLAGPTPVHLSDAGLLCPWVRSEGESSPLLLLASAPSTWAETTEVQLPLPPFPWNLQGDWRAGRALASSGDWLLYLRLRVSKQSHVLKETKCVRVDDTARLDRAFHLVLKPPVLTHCPRL